MPRRALACCSCLALLSATAFADEIVADGIAAQVGAQIVLVSEVMELVGPLEAEAREKGALEAEIAQLRAEALEQLIERRLLAQVVKDAQLQVPDAEVALVSGNGGILSTHSTLILAT